MNGRIRRKLLASSPGFSTVPEPVICPICGRLIPKLQQDAHHFVPKSKGGKVTEVFHRICHRQIHALFTETELARRYNTVEALLVHPEMAHFVDWVKTKPDDFYERTHKSQRVRER
jgi:hypothetical protein